ncbi:MAG: hypothetical protein K6D91_05125 [Prevotella sp.]|nr:hypothetical protein [Prevotella sp.]
MNILDSITNYLDSFFFHHDWEWPVWGIYLVGLLLIAAGYVNRKDRESGNRNTMYTQVGLFIVLSILELTQFLFAERRIWFVRPSEVGWLWTIINGALIITIFFYQVKLFKSTLELANEHAQRQCSWLWGLIGLPISVLIAFWLYSLGHPYWAVTVFLIPQLVQVGIAVYATIKGGKDWLNFGFTLAVYFIGGLAVTIALYVIIWAAIIAITGYVAVLLASKSLSSPTPQQPLAAGEETEQKEGDSPIEN